MDKIELKTQTRTMTGNGPARVLRRQGRVPAILYGRHTEPKMLSVSTYDLEMIFKESSVGHVVLDLVIDDGKNTKSAMIKELQAHPVTQELLHVDLYEVSMDRKIRVNVPVVTTGKSKGVELGGMLQIIRRDLEVLCLPGAIPDTIVVDITDLDIGDAVHVEDIQLDGDIEIQHETNFTVLTVTSHKMEEAAAEEEEEEAEAAEIEETPEAEDEA